MHYVYISLRVSALYGLSILKKKTICEVGLGGMVMGVRVGILGRQFHITLYTHSLLVIISTTFVQGWAASNCF